MVVRRESGLVSSNTHVCTLDPFGGLLSRPQTAISLSKDFFKRDFERNRQCGAIVTPMEGAYGNQERHPRRFAGGV
jgi:hypothetical protein